MTTSMKALRLLFARARAANGCSFGSFSELRGHSSGMESIRCTSGTVDSGDECLGMPKSSAVGAFRHHKRWKDGLRSCCRASVMARDGLLLPVLALPLGDPIRIMHERYASNRVQTADVGSTGGIVEVPLAQTGEGIADCELIQWFVKEGDVVEEFGTLCEVQSDKALVQITSQYKGKVSQINYMPGDIVKVGETLLELVIEGSNKSYSADQAEGVQPTVTSAQPSESSTEFVEEEQSKVITTPTVRHLAKTYGVNLAAINGTGKDGRILKEDVMKFVAAKEGVREDLQGITESMPQPERGTLDSETTASGREYAPVPPETGSGFFNGEDTVIPVRGFRRAMAKAMTAAAAVPHFHYMEEVDVAALVELKDSLSASVPLETGVKLTYLPFLIKSLSVALQKYPIMNSTVNEDATEIRIKATHNVGVAMATSFGLVVPNVKNVQRLSVLEIATEITRLIQLAGTNMLAPEELSGGTITVTNFGAIGGKFGSPILNLPEVAIVAIGRIQRVPRLADDGSVFNSSVMTVTWGADHRVIDGATVAHFCNEWKLLIEQPERLLLHLR